jgi:Fur family transcriptional regulator, iron response regulator
MQPKASNLAATEALLCRAGIRPTRPRLLVAGWLFDGHNKHTTAEQLHKAIRAGGADIALATIYNSLHTLQQAGLLRQVVVDATSVYFDTNITAHHHFFDLTTGALTDIHLHEAPIMHALPAPPAGRMIEQVDIIIRLR